MNRILLFVFVMLALPGLTSCATASSLQLEGHLLASAPSSDMFQFQPVQGTQEEILAKHASDRGKVFAGTATTVAGNPAIQSLGEDETLLAVLIPSGQGQPGQSVRVMRGDQVIFETAAGLPSPVMPLQGLWTYNGHWALEILFTDQSTWAGQIFVDGNLVNQQKGYAEAFGFQLLDGQPFFFFRRNGQMGYSYNGQEASLPYTDIPHYRCCSESVLNPVHAQNMVAFFAQKDAAWFYVELGRFGT